MTRRCLAPGPRTLFAYSTAATCLAYYEDWLYRLLLPPDIGAFASVIRACWPTKCQQTETAGRDDDQALSSQASNPVVANDAFRRQWQPSWIAIHDHWSDYDASSSQWAVACRMLTSLQTEDGMPKNDPALISAVTVAAALAGRWDVALRLGRQYATAPCVNTAAVGWKFPEGSVPVRSLSVFLDVLARCHTVAACVRAGREHADMGVLRDYVVSDRIVQPGTPQTSLNVESQRDPTLHTVFAVLVDQSPTKGDGGRGGE